MELIFQLVSMLLFISISVLFNILLLLWLKCGLNAATGVVAAEINEAESTKQLETLEAPLKPEV